MVVGTVAAIAFYSFGLILFVKMVIEWVRLSEDV